MFASRSRPTFRLLKATLEGFSARFCTCGLDSTYICRCETHSCTDPGDKPPQNASNVLFNKGRSMRLENRDPHCKSETPMMSRPDDERRDLTGRAFCIQYIQTDLHVYVCCTVLQSVCLPRPAFYLRQRLPKARGRVRRGSETCMHTAIYCILYPFLSKELESVLGVLGPGVHSAHPLFCQHCQQIERTLV